ncbi:hypothetical protein SD71_19825 [Cohnella kolymensis]|uniref:AlgX/AlgJ SGNH hydrolase-like domain-containing protein n=1 Tax=Cohnella kolymensis TaxID=1590652 RepID=A0ABR4ZZQ9_9BACL|nr:DHHW family protein [Cohnella kolymensis]KIL34303.1 hypothetical protein SD71_19825 [Cohnella kolymensis]
MKRQAKLNIILFLVFIFGLSAVNLLGAKSQTVSQLEQRAIQQRPAFTIDRFFEGKFTREYDNFFADNFAFRTSLVQVGTDMKQLKGMPVGDTASIVVQGGDNMAVNMNATGEATEAGATAASSTTSKYLILNDRAFTLFAYSPSAAEKYAEALNRFKSSVDPKVRVYSLLAPTSIEFLDNEKYKQMSDSQKVAFDHLNELLDPSIGRVDAYGALNEHRSEYIYFRTDHHWTALGAYYAYTKFMDTIGDKPVPLDRYESGEIEGFLGTAYKGTLNVDLKSNPDTITYYTPFVDNTYTMYTSKGKAAVKKVVDPNYAKRGNGFYAVFLGGDYPWGEIKTSNKNGKRIAVVKDSYANAFVPYLLPHFEKVYYLDPRHMNENMLDFVKREKITDVLFLNNSTVARNDGIAKLLNEKMDLGK